MCSEVVTFQCILTVFERAGIDETIDTAQLTMTLRARLLADVFPAAGFYNIDVTSIVFEGWCQA